jgi:hypothetical protein
MYKLDQMQLVCDIGRLLSDKHGVVDVSSRHMNAIIDAANRLCDEFNRDDITAAAGAGLAAWFGSDHVGMSSVFMARRLAPLAGLVCPPHRIRDEPAYPHDPSDFWRCLKLLEAVPELAEHIPAMAAHGPIWSAYVEHWAEMTALYADEEPTGTAPKLYALMKRLQKESR